ncbi:MAG TPA: phosphoesterase, partial [Caldimonas sp.]
SFDNLFATYRPPAGQSVGNLLSRGIVDADGRPGPNFARAAQREAVVRERYAVTPPLGASYATLPQPSTAHAIGLPRVGADRRFPGDLPNGPYQITRFAD